MENIKIPSYMKDNEFDEELCDKRDYEPNYDPIKHEEEVKKAEEIANSIDENKDDDDVIPLPPQDINTSKAITYLTENQKTVNRIIEEMLAKGYTEITPQNINEWKEILGADLSIEAHNKGGIHMLPEFYTYYNLSNQNKAMIMAQLVAYTELWRGITDSNDMALYMLKEKYQRDFKKSFENLTKEVSLSLETQGELFKTEAQSVIKQIEKSRTELYNLIVQSENVKNGIEKAQEQTLKLVEAKLDKLFQDHIKTASRHAGHQIGKELKEAQMKDIGLKTHLIYIAGTVLTLFIGLGIGKILH